MVNQILRLQSSRYLFLILILLAAGLLVSQPVSGRISIFHTSHYSARYSTAVYSLSGNARITQDFVSKYPGLYRVDVIFRNQGSGDNGEVIFRLKESCEATTALETLVVKTSNIVGHGAYPFIFSPIDDSAGRRFCIVLEPLSLENPTQLGVYASAVDVYPAGTATYKRNTIPEDKSNIRSAPTFSPKYFIWLPIVEKHEGDIIEQEFDLGFKLHYSGPPLDIIKALLTRLAAYKPYPFGTPWFYVFLLAIYSTTLVIIWLLVFNTKSDPKL